MNLMLAILVTPFLSAFIGYSLGKRNEKYRNIFDILSTAVELLLIIMLFPSMRMGIIEYSMPNIMGTGLHLKVDMLRYAMLFITGLAFFLATMYSTQYLIKKKNRNRYYFFFMLTYAMTVGVFMSENILNLFTFFEGMSLTSYALVIHDEDRYSHEAGISYLSMAIAGGMVMLFGILLAYDYTGTLDIGEMGLILPNLGNVKYTIALLVMFGFMIKASVFPLHTWLPKAYPAAPAPSSAILSGILLKTGLFGIMIVVLELMSYDPWLSALIYGLGILNIFLGGILAMFQRNVKRIIAYSSMSQTGFMLMGIGLIGILGEHGGIAMVGTILFMVNHAFFKILLFFGTGIVYMIVGELSINKIQGFGRHKQKLKLFFLVGVLGVTAFPGLSGFVSKTLVHEAILEAYHLTHMEIFKLTEWLFLIGGGLTVAYMLKLFIALFVEHNPSFTGQYKEHVHKRALLPMGILAALILFIGLFPGMIIAPLSAYAGSLGMVIEHTPSLFTLETLTSAVISFSVGIALYAIVIRKMLYKFDAKEGRRIFINPSLKWFSIEANLFAPIFKVCFKGFSILFHIIDNALLWTAQRTAVFFSGVASIDAEAALHETYQKIASTTGHAYSGAQQRVYDGVESQRAVVQQVSEKGQQLLEVGPNTRRLLKLKRAYDQFNYQVTGITSAIFVFGFVVVFSMVFVYYFAHH